MQLQQTYEQKALKRSGVEIWGKNAEKICLNIFSNYGFIIQVFSKSFKVLEVGGYVGCIWVKWCTGIHYAVWKFRLVELQRS